MSWFRNFSRPNNQSQLKQQKRFLQAQQQNQQDQQERLIRALATQQEAYLTAQRGEREATLMAQREESEANLAAEQATLALLREEIRRRSEGPEVWIPVPTPGRSPVQNDTEQVPAERVPRSVSIHREKEHLPITHRTRTCEMASFTPHTRTFPQNDRIKITMRDEREANNNLMRADHHSWLEIPNSPRRQSIMSKNQMESALTDLFRAGCAV